ncbi:MULTISPECIES: HpcH/HpaI aldolase/citrate lyase family protein [Cetobacterium]|nr:MULTISPECIES: aldolase/citrate lyase family protein [Cetobacterium]MCQ8211471.1 CoA ester lyase [Cetobacterium sp. NK01]MCX3066328.1 aldolase/citrate lyase family protein [Cetobacterium somerae]UPO96802.1 CoA ester lyase [Cetobacterium somerae]WVJ01332.1 aldolase/citrate lyase family protein [Cetobacterium somerae]
MKLRRTMLFMPGNNPGMLQTADTFGADSVIFDLEDAVALTEKDAARILVTEAMRTMNYGETEVVIRINPLSSPFAMTDIDKMARLKPDAILLPKATPEDMEILEKELERIEKEEGFEVGTIKVHALVETAYGVETVYETIKSSNRIQAVLLGGEDLAADLAVKRTKDSEELFYARTKVVNACKALKVDAIDTPFTDTNDYEGLAADSRKAKMLGFSGKLAINPRQIDTIHEVYSPTKQEINHALRVMAAKEEAEKEGLGVFSLDGKMVDLPIINRAIQTLEIAEMIGLLD